MQYIDNNRLKFSLYQSLGNYYYASENDLKSALYYYMLAKDIATEDKNLEFLSNVMFHLSELYAKLGHQDSAYYYLSNYSHINNQLTNNAKAIEAYKSYISVFLESSENELKIAEQTILLKSRHIVITVILALTLIALVVFFLILVQQKKKHKEAENYDLEMRLQQELKIQQLREDKIESQVREISSYSLLLSNKDNILQQIVDVSKCKPETKEEIAENYEKINQIIKNNLNTDNDWHNFMLHFEKLHPHFFEKLKSYSNDLTKTNLKMCAYFRVGVSTKEIAQIMNIAPDTIKVTRHRLKKKLGLKEDNNLDDFLRNL
jgi:DNA-binding HTH domain-containing proteins